MEVIIKDNIIKNFTNIVNGKSINNIEIVLNYYLDNTYVYDVVIIYTDNNDFTMTFNDKLSIMKEPTRILYRNLYKNYSTIPIINYTSLPNMGTEISNYFNNSLN